MPLTKAGRRVLSSMVKEYGPDKGKSVFYASINAKKEGSKKWHKKSNKSYDTNTIAMAKAMKG